MSFAQSRQDRRGDAASPEPSRGKECDRAGDARPERGSDRLAQ